MRRLASLTTDQTMQAMILAVVIFAVALAGHAPLWLAAALGGILLAFGLVLLLGRRIDAVFILASPVRDERSSNVHMRASAVTANVIAVVIVGAFLVELFRGNLDPRPWAWLGAVFGATYIVSIVVFSRRG